MSHASKHILIIRLSAMGDVAMTVPVLHCLLAQNPNLKITILTKPFFKPLFRELDGVEVIEARLKKEHNGFMGLYQLSKELRLHGFTHIVDLHNVLRTKILKLFLADYRWIVLDKGRRERKELISGKSFIPIQTVHQRYADVFREMGLGLKLNDWNPTRPERRDEAFKPYFSDTRKTIGLAPFAAHASKSYPKKQTQALISMLSKSFNVLLFGGGPEETRTLEAMASPHETVFNVAGKMEFSKELDLIAQLHLMIAMDSGNGHIAAIYGVPVITVFGVTHPYMGFAPFAQPEDYQLTADRERFPAIPTSVYGNRYPKGYEKAIQTVIPEAIYEKAVEATQESQSTGSSIH